MVCFALVGLLAGTVSARSAPRVAEVRCAFDDEARISALGDRAEDGDADAVRELVRYWSEHAREAESLDPASDGFRALLWSVYFLCTPGVATDEQLGEWTWIELLKAQLGLARRRQEGTAIFELDCVRDLALALRLAGEEEAFEDLKHESLARYAERPSSLAGLHLRLAMAARSVSPRDFAAEEQHLEAAGSVFEEWTEGSERAPLFAQWLGLLTDYQLALGNVDRARESLDEQLVLAQASGDARALESEFIRRCNLYLGTKRLDKLERDLAARLESDEALSEPGRATLWMLRGTGLAESSRDSEEYVPRALAAFRACLESSGVTPSTRVTAQVRLVLLLLRSGEMEKAGKETVILDAMADEYRRKLRRPLPSTERSLIGVVHSQLRRGTAEELRDELEGLVSLLLAEWSNHSAQPGGSGFLHYIGRLQLVSELVDQTLRADPTEAGRERALSWLVEVQARGSLARAANYEFGGLKRLRETLMTSNRGALVYLPAHNSSHLFVIDAEQVLHHELPRWRVLDDLVRDFVGRLESEDDRGDAFEESARELSEAVLPPKALAQMKAWDECWVVGQDLIGYVPFEWLPIAGGGSFRDLQDVCYLPSLPVGEILAARPRRVAKEEPLTLALIVDPKLADDLQGDLPRFQLTEAELERLSSAGAGAKASVWFGEQATYSALASPAVAEADVLQLFVHGHEDPTREPTAGLALAPDEKHDGRVSCDDVQSLHLPPIVIFSSCGAARGVLRRGEDGIGHLGGAALAAGARVVILSPANLELDATIELMSRLHARLLTGRETPARALAGALEDLRRETDYDDPAHARLHVFGLGHRID